MPTGPPRAHTNQERQNPITMAITTAREAHDRVSREWGRGLLLDIHGQGLKPRQFTGEPVTARVWYQLTQRFGTEAITGPKRSFSQLKFMGYKVFPSTTESHINIDMWVGYIVQTYGSHRITPIIRIQLEMGTKLQAGRIWSELPPIWPKPSWCSLRSICRS